MDQRGEQSYSSFEMNTCLEAFSTMFSLSFDAIIHVFDRVDSSFEHSLLETYDSVVVKMLQQRKRTVPHQSIHAHI